MSWAVIAERHIMHKGQYPLSFEIWIIL